MTSKNVDSELVWLILAAVVGAYVFLSGFPKKINEWYYVLRLGKKKHSSLPPGDMGWPFIGNMISFVRAFRSQDPDSFTNNLVHRSCLLSLVFLLSKYGFPLTATLTALVNFIDRYGHTGIYKTSLFGNPSIIVCSPDLCREVLMDGERFEYGYPSSLNKLFGERRSLHDVSNSEHRHLRRLLSLPINGHEALSNQIGYIEDIVVSSLEDWVHINSEIELLTELKTINFKVMTRILMGSADSISESMTKDYTRLFQGLMSPLPIDVPGFTYHRALEARKILVNALQAHLDERRCKNNDDPNIKTGVIDILLEAKDEDGEKLDNELIVNVILAFLLAGHETTAHAATRLTAYLHDHPEILQRVREEQVEIVTRRSSSQKGLTLNEIRQMECLSKAIDETMRLSTMPFAIFRKATDDVNVNGYIIPKGWKVLVWSRAVHMNPKIYSNPKDFLPSRWDDHKPKAGSFIPFGAGSRTCPGADLAKIEMCIFIHYFLLNYRLERVNPKSPVVFPSPSPEDNCLARITKLPSP
ncbi:hypothetical protein V6N13_064981 [Hibiscus sabdariffa]|uniref:Cytochrome P450 n=1 Tax=Hibiscus sabdariffa TaxID=183260 RepID=A0ABR2QSJ6_9ROSI